jgi:MFS family permease
VSGAPVAPQSPPDPSSLRAAPRSIAPGAWYALALVALCNAMSLLDRNILAILAPRIKADLKVGDAEMGLLYGTVFALFYALFSLPLGRLSDGWMRNRILGLAIGFWSIASGLAAFATGFGLLVLSRLGVGIGEAATAPAGTSIMYDYFPRERRGLVMAVLAAAISFGLGLSFIIGGVAADWWDARYAGGGAPLHFSGWQFAFLVAAIPGVVLAIFLWFMKEPVRGVMDGIPTPHDPAPFKASGALLGMVTPGTNFLNLATRKAGPKHWLASIGCIVVVVAIMTALVHAATAFSPRPSLNFAGISVNPHVLQWLVVGFGTIVIFNLMQGLSLSDAPAFRLIAGSPSVLMILGVGVCQTIINYGVMGFTPTFLMQTYGESATQTALRFGLMSGAVGIVGPMISGPLSDLIATRIPGVGRISVTLVSLGISPFIAIWVYSAPDATSFYLRFALYSVILTAWLPPLFAVLYELVLPRMRGIMASTYLIVTTIFGLGIGPYVVGLISDANGHNLGSAILTINLVGIPSVIMLICLCFRASKDQALMLPRAREAGEPVARDVQG